MKIVTRKSTAEEIVRVFNKFASEQIAIKNYEHNESVQVTTSKDEVTIEIVDNDVMPVVTFIARFVALVGVPMWMVYRSFNILLKPEVKAFQKAVSKLLAPDGNDTMSVELFLSKEEKTAGSLLAKELNVDYYTSGKVSGKPWEVVNLYGAKKDVKKMMSYLPTNVLRTVKIGEEFSWGRIEVLATRCGLTDVDGIKGGIIVGGPEDKVDWFIETVGNEFDITEIKEVELKKVDLED